MNKKNIFTFILFFTLFSLVVFSWLPLSYSTWSTPDKKQSLEQKIGDTSYHPHRVIVKMKDKSAPWTVALHSVSSSVKLAKIEHMEALGLGIVHLSKTGATDLEQYVAELNKMPDIEYAELDYERHLFYTGVVTNDTRSIEQWYLKSIAADEAWELYNDLENKITVAVNDTGISYNHSDLAGNLKNLSSSCLSDTGATISGWCPYSGWNFEWNYVSDQYDPFTAVLDENDSYDIDGHGTHVAGTIGAVWYNGTGTIGVTQNVEIIGARIETYMKPMELFFFPIRYELLILRFKMEPK